MGFFDRPSHSEADNDDGARVRLVRDKYGRLAVSRPSARTQARPKKIAPPQASSSETGKENEANAAESKDTVESNSSKESVKVASSQKSKASLEIEWGDEEDCQLFELKCDQKSWDYIAGKMDGKGKDIPALKARFHELTLQKVQQSRKESKETKPEKEEKKSEDEVAKIENENSSSSEKGKKNKGKNKGETDAESDSASKKSGKGSPKTVGILKKSPKHVKTESDSAQETVKNDVQAPKQTSAYIGRGGLGELHFFDGGRRVLYQYTGDKKEALDAQAVALLQKEATRYDRGKWLAISSRLYDKAGIRIDPGLVQRAFEE